MEFKDVEFKEGIHKSVRKVPSETENEAVSHEQDSTSDAATTPVSEATSASMLPLTPTDVPGRRRSRYGRGWQILTFVLIVCIIGGSMLVFLKLHTTQPASVAKLPTPTPSLKNTLCPVQGAPFSANGPTSLSAVSAFSASDVWAVGNANYLPLVEHWDGQNWKLVPISTPNSTIPRDQLGQNTQDSLDGVVAIANNDAWAVGRSITNGISHGLIEHWDGSAWSTASLLPPGSSLNTIASVFANDVWAIGQSATSNGTLDALIEHWDGQSWSQMQLPAVFRVGEIVSIAAVASNDVWADEYHPGSRTGALGTTTMLHWDGYMWTPYPLPSLNFGFILLSLSALNAHDIWAVGTGTSTLLIEHWDGTSWSIASNAESPESFSTLGGVVAVSANDVWAVGGRNQLLIDHWNGKNWTLLPQASATGGLNGVATADGKVWAVGASQGDSSPLIEANC